MYWYPQYINIKQIFSLSSGSNRQAAGDQNEVFSQIMVYWNTVQAEHIIEYYCHAALDQAAGPHSCAVTHWRFDCFVSSRRWWRVRVPGDCSSHGSWLSLNVTRSSLKSPWINITCYLSKINTLSAHICIEFRFNGQRETRRGNSIRIVQSFKRKSKYGYWSKNF